MLIEIENKYNILTDNVDILKAQLHKLETKEFLISEGEQRLIVDEYYDTKHLNFKNEGISLRLRKEDGIYKLTLKCKIGKDSSEGLCRKEIEKELNFDTIIKVFNFIKKKDLIHEDMEFTTSKIFEIICESFNLMKVFKIENKRLPFLISKKNLKGKPFAELSIDSAQYLSNDKSYPFKELEIELINKKLFKEFIGFIQQFELQFNKLVESSFASKYEKGIILCKGKLYAN